MKTIWILKSEYSKMRLTFLYKIRDCICSRTEIVAVDIHTSLNDLKTLFVESGLSKIIVFDGNIDNIVGYIHSSEMFKQSDDWLKT